MKTFSFHLAYFILVLIFYSCNHENPVTVYKVKKTDSLIAKQNNKENSQEELGDLLFSIVNLSRHLEIDASEAINQANHKFVKRFSLMEEEIAKDKKQLDNLSPEELEEFWVRIKLH